MNPTNELISIRIDNKSFKVEKGITILKAAQQNNIFIPSLCAYDGLTPHGGCRICIIEVEGIKGFLKSCSTPVQDGMVIKTNTDQIQDERRKILQLLLSEHTSSCLICDEKEECKNSMGTIRKVGVTTGCRFCPADNRCELQKVVEWVGIDYLIYPVYYRNLRVEKEDPFYDRDYNLCILCGRCVRICQEVRTANILAFNQRGRDTVIGPAFGRNHIEAGCEFCGACVEVCPTGALAERSNKWNGVHQREELTTCAFCGVGCQMRVLIKNDRVIGTLPAEDELVNHGQLCVKGRFCVNEMVNHYQRIKKPTRFQNGTHLQIPLDEALEIAAEQLKACPPDKFGLLISPNCTNEDLYIAQKFVRTVMGCHHIDTSARLFYGAGFNAYLNLIKMSTSLSELKKSSIILSIGLDLRYGRSVVGVLIRKAIAQGAKIVTIHPNDHSLTLPSEIWIQPKPGEEEVVLSDIANLLDQKNVRRKNSDLLKLVNLLKNTENPVILVGSEFLQYTNAVKILNLIENLAKKLNAKILALPAQNNFFGSLLMGTYPELLPGGLAAEETKNIQYLKKNWGQTVPEFSPGWNLEKILSGKKLKVAYLIGEVPPISEPISDYLIYQNIYPLEHNQIPDLTLPAATFTEIDGSFINGEGRIQPVRKSVPPPGDALPDWLIICKIAQKMGSKLFDYQNVSDIHAEISKFVKQFTDFEHIDRQPIALPESIALEIKRKKTRTGIKPSEEKLFALTFTKAEHIYRGIFLAEKAEGLKKLIPEDVAIINTDDADNLGLNNNDFVQLISDEIEESVPVWISGNQQQGTIHIISRNYQQINHNPHFVKLRRYNV